MSKIKRFFDCFVPVFSCNLKCSYCYVTQHTVRKEGEVFHYSAEEVYSALSQDRLGGICCFNLCGDGETLYPADIIPIIHSILKRGHFVNIITNGTMTDRFKEILKFPESCRDRLFVKFSYHYLELHTHRLTEIFFRNFNMLRKNGISVSLEIIGDDKYVPHIEAIKKEAMEYAGALPHVSIPRKEYGIIPLASDYSMQEFERRWSGFQSRMLTFKISTWGQKEKNFCYAGEWSGILNLGTGEFSACYGQPVLQNIFAHPEEKIQFRAVGHHCAMPHCYNSHAFLTFGVIPDRTPLTYADMRNRKTARGEWLTPCMKQFFSSKLQDSNPRFSVFRRMWIDGRESLSRIRAAFSRKRRNLIFLIREKDWQGLRNRLQENFFPGKTLKPFEKEQNNGQ